MDTFEQYAHFARSQNTDAAIIRGYIIHHFVVVEAIIKKIVVLKYNTNPNAKNDELKPLFFKAFEEYETEINKPYPNIKERIHEAYNVRDIMAHWMVNTTLPSVEDYEKNGNINFVKTMHDGTIENLYIVNNKKFDSLIQRIKFCVRACDAINRHFDKKKRHSQ